MTAYFPTNRETRLGTDSRVFLYEVAICPSAADLGKFNGLKYRQDKIYFKVPFARMNQAMREISRLRGKILSITPLKAGTVLPSPASKNTGQLRRDYSYIGPPSGTNLPWWVEILTACPHCLYYFGPFETFEAAQENQAGYIEDLQDEGADGVAIKILQCQPQILTQELSD